MDKITEKFGSFDLLVTTFPGAYFILLLKNVFEFFDNIMSSPKNSSSFVENFFSVLDFSPCLPRSIYEFVAFSFAAFIVGIILQELSSTIKERIAYRNGKPQQLLLEKNKGILTLSQLTQFTPIFVKLCKNSVLFPDDKNERMDLSQHIFHQINSTCQKNGIASKYVKLSIISNMSFSLFLASIIIELFVVIFDIQMLILGKSITGTIIIFVVLALACRVFYKRGKKYNVFWVRNLIYAYEASADK